MPDIEVPTDPVPLATSADLVKRFPSLVEDMDPELLDETMVRPLILLRKWWDAV